MNMIIPGSMDKVRTSSMEPVDIHLLGKVTGEGVHLRIPKGYMTYKRNWAGGVQTEIIKIETRLPDLQPAVALFRSSAQEDTPEFEAGQKKRNNGIIINIQPGIIRDRTEKSFEDNNYLWYQRKYILQDEEMFGLEHFLHQLCKTEEDNNVNDIKDCWYLQKEYFVAKNEDKRKWLFFRCTRPDINPGAGCVVNTRFENVRVQYIYRRSQLHRWQEFEEGVQKLLGQFYVDEVKKTEKE